MVVFTIWAQWDRILENWGWYFILKERSFTELYAVAQLNKPWVIYRKENIKVTLTYETEHLLCYLSQDDLCWYVEHMGTAYSVTENTRKKY